MRSKIFAILCILSLSVLIGGCSGGTTQPNANSGNSTVANGNTNNPLAVTTPTPEATTNDAPTLTPVYKAYCDAMAKKDEAALRKVYSSDTIKFFEEQMKLDKVKTLLQYLDAEKPSKLCEARNEQINGDSAVAEIRADSYPNGIKIVFVKENGEWKMTNKSPAVDAVNKTASNSNAAK